MATRVIDVPGGIAFAGFYYPEILRELLLFMRSVKDQTGLTDENDFEVHVQMMRAFALIGHLNNTRLDSLATEMFIDSAQLLASVKLLLRLMGIELKSATPAVADLLAELGGVTVLDQTDFIPPVSEFETADVPPIAYEASEDGLDLTRTDQVSHVYALLQQEVSSGTTLASVSTGSDVITRASGVWPTSIVGDEIFITSSSFDNKKRCRVISRVDDQRVRVVEIPGSTDPGFQTETGMAWVHSAYSVDYASLANGAGTFTPFPGSAVAGDAMYVSHDQVLPSQVDLAFSSSIDPGVQGVWEYYDDERSAFNPLEIVEDASTFYVNLNALLGTKDARGALVEVTYLKTGASEKIISLYGDPTQLSGGSINYCVTTGLLGQAVISEDVEDYFISADWIPFPNPMEDMSVNNTDLVNDGTANWDLPQDSDRSWLETGINLIDGRWFRFRIVNVLGANRPVIDTIDIDQGSQYIVFIVTQGNTIGPQIIGSSTGQAHQEFKLPELPYLDDTETVEVDEGGGGIFVEYTKVDTFLLSSSTDRHYTRRATAKDEAIIRFGDGINGKIPPAGVGNIQATWRVGGAENGNVGADQITVNAEGVTGITSITNPRSATGYRAKDGANTLDLERVKRDAPAELRIRGTAAKPADAARLAVDEFVDASGIKPVERAEAFEEGFGPKTTKLLVVGLGGNILTATQLTSLDTYFNGDRLARPVVDGVLLMNHELTSVNYEPAVITVEANVVWPGGSAEVIRNVLLAFLNPLALAEDGTTRLWDFGAQVSLSRVYNLIHGADPNISDVPVLKLAKGGATPLSSSVNLSPNELPVTKASLISISIQEQ